MSDELSHSLLTYIDQRLSIAADKPTSYNVAELLGPYPNQGGKRRLEQLVSLTDTQAVFVDERVFRPQVAFETMHTAHNAIRVVPKPPTISPFATGLQTSSGKILDDSILSDSEFVIDPTVVQGLRTAVQTIRKAYDDILPSLGKVLASLTANDGFSLCDDVSKLETLKNNRLTAGRTTVTALGDKLQGIFTDIANTDFQGEQANNPILSELRPANFPHLNYYTDKAFHNKLKTINRHNRTVIKSEDWKQHCNCPTVTDVNKWLRCSVFGQDGEVDGHKLTYSSGDDVFCMRPLLDEYKTFPLSRLADYLGNNFCSEEESLRQDNAYNRAGGPFRHARASWNPTTSAVIWAKLPGWADQPEFFSTNNKITELTGGILYEWSMAWVLQEQWKRLSRTAAHLKEVKQAGADCVEPVKQVIGYLQELRNIYCDLDSMLEDLSELMLVTGSKSVLENSVVPDIQLALDRVQWINHSLFDFKYKTTHPRVEVNISDFWADHVVPMANTDEFQPPCIPNTSGFPRWTSDVLEAMRVSRFYRSIPFPRWENKPFWILAGFTSLDFSRANDLRLDSTISNITSHGFDFDPGFVLDSNITDCHNMKFSWMPISMKCSKAYASDVVTFGNANGTFGPNDSVYDFQQKVWDQTVTINDTVKKTQPKFEVLLGGVNLKQGRDWKVSLTTNINDSTYGIKMRNEGSSGIDYLMARWIAWDPNVLKAFTKTFTTVKMDKNTSHTETIDFGGAFSAKPTLMYGIKAFKVEGRANLRIDSSVQELTKDRAVVKVWTWDDTEVTATFLVFAAPYADIHS